MKADDLIRIWYAPDHSKLIPKQWSIRLPIQVAAKINALCDIFHNKTKTEIISDLLTIAIDQLESQLPSTKGKQLENDAITGKPVYEDIGLKGKYLTAAEFHLRFLEKEAGVKEPMPFPKPVIIGKGK